MQLGKKKSQPDRQRRTAVPPNSNSRVFSYYSNRSPETGQRSRLRPEDHVSASRARPGLPFRLSSIPTVLAALIIVACLGYNFFLSTDPRIIVQGQAADKTLLKDMELYEQEIRAALTSSVFNRSKLTFQTNKVHTSLTESFPELADVRVSLPLMGIKPVVHLVPAAPALVLVAADGSSYVVDDTGRVISTNVAKVPQNVPVVNDRSGIDVTLGQHVLARSNVEFILRLMYQLERKDYRVASLLLPAGTQELQVRFKDRQSYARISLREDPVKQAGTFLAADAYLKREGKKATKYIDVRVGERVYYR